MLADLLTRAVPPWLRWLAIAALMAAIYGTGRVHQARVDHAAQVAEQLVRAQAVADWLDRHARASRAIEAAHEGDRERIRTIYRNIAREVTHVVERPVYRDCRVDVDGLRLWAAANRGDSPPPDAAPVADR